VHPISGAGVILYVCFLQLLLQDTFISYMFLGRRCVMCLVMQRCKINFETYYIPLLGQSFESHRPSAESLILKLTFDTTLIV